MRTGNTIRRLSGIALIAGCVAAPFLVCMCTNMAGIETTNGDGTLTVSSNMLSGTAPSYSLVSCNTHEYTPFTDSTTALVTTADDSGRFVFDSIPADTYTVMISSPDNRFASLIRNVHVGKETLDSTRHFILTKTGTIAGNVAREQPDSCMILVYLTGTAIHTILSDPGPFEIGGVPPGDYEVQAAVILPEKKEQAPQVSTDDNRNHVVVPPGERVSAGELRL